MGNKNLFREEIEKLFKAKDLFHRELSKISFDKKIKILIQLQKIAMVLGHL